MIVVSETEELSERPSEKLGQEFRWAVVLPLPGERDAGYVEQHGDADKGRGVAVEHHWRGEIIFLAFSSFYPI